MADGLPSGIDRRPSGKYRARYRDRDGRQYSKSFTRLKDATTWRNNQLADLSRGAHIDPDAGRITFHEYGTHWLKHQGFDRSTHDQVEMRLRLHVFPSLGRIELQNLTPTHIRTWLMHLKGAASTKRVIFTNVSSILSAAVDDRLIHSNPCKVRSVKSPKVESRKVIPWEAERVYAVHDNLSEQYRILATLGAGLGLRQGELFGLSPDDIDFLRGKVTVQRQVKVYGGNRLVFALPKNNKTREVPLPGSVRDELAAYLAKFPAKSVTLPWGVPEGEPVTVPLVVTSRESKALNRNYFNASIWKPSLKKSGVPTDRDDHNGMHALRHFYASVLLDAGESIKAVSEYLGHTDPGFTLRVYTHLMPTSDERSRSAVDAVLLRSRVPDVSQVAVLGR